MEPPPPYSNSNGLLSHQSERMQDDHDNLQEEAAERVSNRFLHSDENLEECNTDEEDDDDDDENDVPAKRQTAFLREQQRGDDDASKNNASRLPHQWANRQLHRSVSVDDLMEYQREFRLEEVGRASSAHDLTDYQREFRAILAEKQEQQECLREACRDAGSTNASNNNNEDIPSEAAVASDNRRQRLVRNSIANSDLAEFKRQFCQERAARTMRRAKSADDARILKSNKEHIITAKLNNLKNTNHTMDYQWGTRSLRRAILGSDLGTFERSVRTALLESSRENSSSGSVDSADKEEVDMLALQASCDSSDGVSSLGMNHRDSQDLRRKPIPAALLEEPEEDWGTRSLRKSLKELDLMDPQDPTATPPYRPKPIQRIESVQEEELELPLDANISPWKNPLPASSNGLKMPRRVTSGDSVHPDDPRGNQQEQQQQLQDDSCSNNDNNKLGMAKPSSSSPQSRSVSLNDIGAASGSPMAGTVGAANQSDEPEFEWQLRSRFRRSISSSDIEKYQRHFDGPGMDDDSERVFDMPDDNGNTKQPPSLDDRSAHTVAVVESTPGASAAEANGGMDRLHPLLAPASQPLISLDDNQNDEDADQDTVPAMTRPRRSSRRRHRRSTSDEPELHMENFNADVAPRKPTRTTSRPISPPPPRSAVVRFADNCTQVVEIPKVSEDMKPFLFYTKRDVKRFRMNEHRRQEEQIRSYMEYLNKKDNALDASPSIYD